MRYVGKGSVAGVIGSYNYKGFYDSDLDNLKVQGFYNLSENVTNVPSEYSGYKNASFVLVFIYSDTQGQQTFLGRQGSVFHRTLYNGTWSAWSRIDNFGYNSLAELSAGVSPYLFAGVGNNSGLKSGTFTLKTGESISIALGAGVLMLFTDGGQVFSLLGINYWTTEIKTIYTDGRSLNITVTKNDTSGTVTFTAASNRKFHYIFFGE